MSSSSRSEMGTPGEQKSIATPAQLYTNLELQAQRSLDRVVSQCAEEFGCQMSLVTVLEPDRQCFLATHGTDLRETPRGLSFCQFALESQSPMLVGDASMDDRFRDNPLVAGPPNLRSYLGIPIRHCDGEFLGALCLVDPRPNFFEEHDVARLKRHATVVEDILKLHMLHLEATELNRQISQQSEELKKSLRIWQQAESIAKIGTWELDIETNELHWSDGVYAIHGLTERRPVTVDEAIGYYDAADRESVSRHVEKAVSQQKLFCYDATLHALDGTVKRVRSMGEGFDIVDGKPRRVLGVFQDISETYRAELSLRHAADHDALTSLLNRAAFDRELKARIAAARGGDGSVHLVLFDLDGFKDLNDTFGHVMGDHVLKDIARRITRAAPPHSTVARWGGDEFAVILPRDSDGATAERQANAMLDGIRHCAEIGGRTFELSATAGLVTADGAVGPKELVRHADTALYHGKRTNRSSIQRYNSELERQKSERQAAIDEVSEALRTNRVFVGYMPIVDLRSGVTVGLEALMRLTTTTGRRMTAAEVAPALVDPLLSRKVDERMMSLIAEEAPALLAAHPQLKRISINATEGDLVSRDFVERFLSRFRANGVDPSMITLEVTETMLLVDQSDRLQAVLRELRAAGVRIALDDFGTGYSSLTHLRDFPIDAVKLDLSFVQAMTEEDQSRSIVQAMIGMARNMGITVVAEGIESEEQLRILQLMNCSYGQGYLFGKARPVQELTIEAGAETGECRLSA